MEQIEKALLGVVGDEMRKALAILTQKYALTSEEVKTCEDVEEFEATATIITGCPMCHDPTETRTRECNHKLCWSCYREMRADVHVKCPTCSSTFTDLKCQMTDAEKISDYERLRSECDRLISEVNASNRERGLIQMRFDLAQARLEQHDLMRMRNDVEQSRLEMSCQDRQESSVEEQEEKEEISIGMDVEENIATQPHPQPNPGNVLGDIRFTLRARQSCCIEGCHRKTRRVCNGCRDIRVCVEHNKCLYCARIVV